MDIRPNLSQPTDRARRRFLRTASATAGYAALAGCGGSDAAAPLGSGGSGTSVTAGAAPAGLGASGTDTLPTNNSPVGGGTLPSFELRSAVGGARVPFAFGQAFARGDVPAGSTLTTDLGEFQVSPLSTWRDGSVRFALIAGHANLPAGTARQFALRTVPGRTNGGLTTADLKATGATATIGYGANGSASWAGADWDSPFVTHAEGTSMSSWVYRKGIGSDPHLVAWIEVRCFAGGAVEFLPWIENGYLLRAGPGARSGVASFVLGGTQRFSQSLALLNHTRAVLASGTPLSHWLGADPQMLVRHDVSYLKATRLVPNYIASTPSNSSIFASMASAYTPLAAHDFPSVMGSAGFDKSIGPLPEWEVAYVTGNADPRAWRAIQINGYAAGRYGTHFRDESTQRAPRFSAYPNLALDTGQTSNVKDSGSSSTGQYTPAASDGAPPVFANSHMPSIGYMPYLLTGRWYFVDEMQLLGATLYLKQTDTTRQGSRGVIVSSSGNNQTRGAAWTLRHLAMVAALTPDRDTTLRAEFTASLDANIEWYWQRYTQQATNPLGLVQPYGDYTSGDGRFTAAWWMDDFLTFSFGLMRDLQAHSAGSDARLDQFLAWKYRAIVGRLGPDQAGSHSYRRAAQYEAVYGPRYGDLDYAGGTGPWYADWGAAYAAMGHPANGSGTALIGSYVAESAFAETYWANLQPAIAYAVDHGAAGARDAYLRMTSASNWQASAAFFSSGTPIWGIAPRTQ